MNSLQNKGKRKKELVMMTSLQNKGKRKRS
jgi:hypothetical protein